MLVTWGAGTVKYRFVLLETPPSVTFTGPVVAADGTVTTICASLQLMTGEAELLSVTALEPCAAPKPLPLIWIWVPAMPLEGDRLAMLGLGMVNNMFWLLLRK